MLAADNHIARFWDLWGPAYTCPYLSERMGRVGGWWEVGVWFEHSTSEAYCLVFVFSIGSSGEASFEQAILSSTACEVHTWDHTLNDEQKESVLKVPALNLHDFGLASQSSAAQADMMTLSGMLEAVQRHWCDVLKLDIEGANLLSILAAMYDLGLSSECSLLPCSFTLPFS